MGDASVRRAIGPRLVSPSVRAAEKLPSSIKTQSVKNQLLRGGAKPLELEYAGFDEWLSGQGDRVASEDVIRHLSGRGPLGRVQRLDAQGQTPRDMSALEEYREVVDPVDGEEAEAALDSAQFLYDDLSDDAKKFAAKVHGDDVWPDQQPRMPAEADQPVGESRYSPWPFTKYERHTETDAHGWNGDNYREVYWVDPATGTHRSRRTGIFNPLADPGPVDAHSTDAWVRYHVNQDRDLGTVLDVQNIQSDIGQRVSRAENMRPMSGTEANLYYGYRDAASRMSDAVEQVSDEITDWVLGNSAVVQPVLNAYNTRAQAVNSGYAPRGITAAAAEFGTSDNFNVFKNYVVDNLPQGAREQLLGLLQKKHSAQFQRRVANLALERYTQQLEHLGVGGVGSNRGIIDGLWPSPLFRNDNWMQLPLRHLLLESASMGGAPIRLPLGVNVRAVEQMPRGAARYMYERVVPNKMRSILRPIGGAETWRVPGVRKQQYDWEPHEDADPLRRSVVVGPDGQRAGTVIVPTDKAIDYINKHGLDFLSLLLLAGAGTGAAMNSQPQPAQGQVQ